MHCWTSMIVVDVCDLDWILQELQLACAAAS